MLLKWLDAREATAAGAALADDFYLQSGTTLQRATAKESPGRQRQPELQKFLRKFLQGVDQATRPLKLNFFKRAKLANSFKWRLLEKGVEPEVVNELTQALVLRLGAPQAAAAMTAVPTSRRADRRHAEALHVRAFECLNRNDFPAALACYEELLSLDPKDSVARNGLGIALARLNRFNEAEQQLRIAIGSREGFVEAYFNLAGVLQSLGRYAESEAPLRRALKLRPTYVDVHASLGMTLVQLSRFEEARGSYGKALRLAPRNSPSLVGIGQIDLLEGRFAEAEAACRKALEIDPRAPFAWAALARLQKMTPADRDWLRNAEEVADSGLSSTDESTLRFAIGKYYDDVGEYQDAFRAYRRANELQKLRARPYNSEGHARFVDDLIRVYSPEMISAGVKGASDSARPLFVVGMPRSGTSLVEQILATHPAVYGAGELDFWLSAVNKHEAALRAGPLPEPVRHKLAGDYLRLLERRSPSALRVVDKAPINADYLGIIHSVFPNARVINMLRDPIDTCLSCYFQQFSPAMTFAMDLPDLAAYYRQHHRLAAHWRQTLPAGVVLDVPYEELVTDSAAWTRRIVEFVGLPWDERCLDFHQTTRVVNTASVWQVRQKVYKTSVQRWRNYEKFIEPLLPLERLGP